MKPLTDRIVSLVLFAVLFGGFVPHADAAKVWKGDAHSRPTPIKTADGSYPVIAKDRSGRFIDKRTGTDITEDKGALDAADEAGRLNGGVPDVTLWSGKSEPVAAGMNGNGFENGRIAHEGENSKAHLDVMRAEASAAAEFGASSGNASVEAKLVALEIAGEASRTFGDPNGVSAEVKVKAKVQVGAEAKADVGYVRDGTTVAANGGFSVSVGGKAEAEIGGSVTICGVKIENTTSGFVSYGAGIEARGHFGYDIAQMKFKMGGHTSATLGAGAGVGTDVEISLAKLFEDPRAAGRCAADHMKDALAVQVEPLAKGARHVWSALGTLRRRAIDGVVALNEAARAARHRLEAEPRVDPAGVNVGRFAETRPLETRPAAQQRSTGRRTGGGQTR